VAADALALEVRGMYSEVLCWHAGERRDRF